MIDWETKFKHFQVTLIIYGKYIVTASIYMEGGPLVRPLFVIHILFTLEI